MEKKENKVVKFIKDHKKPIIAGAIGVGAAIGGVILYALGKKDSEPQLFFNGVFSTPNAKDISIADWSTGNLAECWRENGHVNLIVENFTVADAGKLGKELLKIDGVTAETALDAVMGFAEVVD